MKKLFALIGLVLVTLFISSDLPAQNRPIAYVPPGTGYMRVIGGVQSGVTTIPLADTAYVTGTLAPGNGGTGLASPGTSGNVLTSNGTAWVSSTPGGGWATAMDCDLTAEASQSLTAGSKTFCSRTWTSAPGASGRGTTALVNGTGLVFNASTGGTAYTANIGGGGGAHSAGRVWLPLSQLGISGLSWETQFRIWLYVTSQPMTGCTGGNVAIFTGIDNNPPVDFTAFTSFFSIMGWRGCSNLTTPILGADVVLGSNSTGPALAAQAITGYTSWTANNSTTVFYTGQLAGPARGRAARTYFAGAYSGGWANVKTLVPWSISQRDMTSGRVNDTGIGWANNVATPVATDLDTILGIMLGYANTDGGTTSTSATIARIRIDYLN